jgi:hypothetical protein
MDIRRAARLGLAELAGRTRQEASKWLDRQIDSRRTRATWAAPDDLVDRCLEELPRRFFAGASDPGTTRLLRERLPECGPRIVAAAERTRQKRFDLLGYRELSFGDPIDWHVDPVANRRAPLLHWTRLDPLDAATVGDSKVVWELNRHQWLVRLGQAYALTGDEGYGDAFVETMTSWSRANPPGMGINWASSLEAAMRLISWCWALSLFRGSAALTAKVRTDLIEGIAIHASRIEKYLSHYFSPNTHLTGEALGLFYAGALFPLLPGARRWRQLGAEILVQESRRQILPDGVYMEQATCYQRYTVEIYLHFVLLAARNDIPVSTDVIERLEKLVEALLVLRRPDGVIPSIGDADGGWLLPLEPRAPGDGAGIFAVAAGVLNRGDFAWAAGGLTPENLWLLGPEGARVLDRLESTAPKQAPSRLLPDGGYAVMRSDWGRHSDQIILDGGPLGCHISGGHGHADLLSIQCSFRGQPYLVDPGTFRYTADDGWRAHYRGTAAHNTVEIDGVGQAVPRGPFGWMTRPRARIIRWASSPSLDWATAEHRAYSALPDPVTHRRSVIFAKPRYCVVVDDLEGAAEHRIALRFQFAPMPVTSDASGWLRAGRGTGTGLFVHAFATTALKVTILEGDADLRQGWVSTDYGRHEPAPLLLYAATAILPVRVLTLLLPTDALQGPPPDVSALIEDGWLRGLSFEDGREVLRVDEVAR